MTKEAEKPIEKLHSCPTCEREFKEAIDFPYISVLSVEIADPEQVPAEVEGWHTENLLPAPVKGWNRELVPQEVLEYFQENPEQNKLTHTDEYIYETPKKNVAGDSKTVEFYTRKLNYAPTVKKVLQENRMLGAHLRYLQHMEGEIHSPRDIYPDWEKMFGTEISRPRVIPGTEEFLALQWSEEPSEETNHRIINISIYGPGPNLGSAGGPTIVSLWQIGEIHYEGLLDNP